tara:strand:- start:815 stop:1438 length:624 start_codon:yes stop_codon:yes gene_type:complete
MIGSFGRKSRGRDIGKKESKFKKGVKTLGLALVAGAGVYAATHSGSNEHKEHEEEQSRKQRLDVQLDEHREELAAQGAKPAPAPAVEFGQSGSGGKLDKIQDVLDVAGTAVGAAKDVDEATGKFGKAKAAAKGAKAVVGAAKDVGKKDTQAKFEAGALTDEQAKKFAGKQMKKAEREARIRLCDGKYPKGTGAKTATKRKLCYKTGS